MISHTFAVCAYKDSPYLESCIKSLLKQTIPVKIILCTSTPSPFLEQMAKKYHLPFHIREGQSDIQDDWNFAVQMADSDLVTITHQDDMYHKAYAETVQKCWSRYPDATVMMTDAVIIKHGELQKPDLVEFVKKCLRLPLRMNRFNHLRWVKRAALMFGNPIMCPSCTYNKKELGDQMFQSVYKFALDWDTMVSLADRKGRFVSVERPLLYYRVHEAATTKQCIKDHRRDQEEREMFLKFWPPRVVDLLMKGYQKAYGSYD